MVDYNFYSYFLFKWNKLINTCLDEISKESPLPLYTDWKLLFYYKYILSLICFARMNFSEQYHIKRKAFDVRCDDKSILSNTYQ